MTSTAESWSWTYESVRAAIASSAASWRRHRTIRLGAGLSYYGLVAIVPLIIIALSVSGLVLDVDEVSATVSQFVSDVFGIDSFDIAIDVERELDAQISALGTLGLVSLVVTASMLFVALQDAFDTIWEFPVRTGWRSLRRRLIAMGVVLLAGVAMIASFLVHTASEVIRDVGQSDAPAVRAAIDATASLGVWVISGFILGLLFHKLPGSDPAWRPSLIGGLATTAAIGVASRLVSIYFDNVGTTSIAAAAGSLFVVLAWIYTTAQVVLAGAELTRTLDRSPAAADQEIARARAALAETTPISPS